MNEDIRINEELTQRLPLPLAQVYRRAHNAKNALERHLSAYYLWEASLKLLGAIAIVEYATLQHEDESVRQLLQSLARPATGNWWSYVRRLVPIIADSGAPSFQAVREFLLDKKRRHDLPRAAGLESVLRETLEGARSTGTTVRMDQLLDRVIAYRNAEMGHGAAGQRSGEHYERVGRALLLGAADVLSRLDILAGRRLIYVADVRRRATGMWLVERYELVGETARRIESLEYDADLAHELPRPERVYAEVSDNQAGLNVLRPLHPLVIYEAESDSVFFLNGRRGKRLAEYLCYTTGDVVKRDGLESEHRNLLSEVLGVAVDDESISKWGDQTSIEVPVGYAVETTGKTIGEFELISSIGRGAMGAVYRALQPSLGRQVALKRLLNSGHDIAEARFAREIRALGSVEHPNLVKIFTSGCDGDVWYYAMELIEGTSLDKVCEHLAKNSPIELEETHWQMAVTTAFQTSRQSEKTLGGKPDADDSIIPELREVITPPPQTAERLSQRGGHIDHIVEIMRQVAEATHALHTAGVIHRDIKPANIMLAPNGLQAVLMDLGLAQLADDSDGTLTRTREFVGSLRYASPEQVLCLRLDARSDVYSLGATLWELLALQPLFGATDQKMAPGELMLKIETAEPRNPRRINRRIPADLAAVVLKCLEKDPSRRYATAEQLAEDLARWQRGQPVMAQPPTLSYVLRKYAWRYKVPLSIAATVLLMTVAGTVIAFVNITQARADAERNRTTAEDNLDTAINAVYQMLLRVADEDLARAEHGTQLQAKMMQDAVNFYEHLREQNPDSLDLNIAYGRGKLRLGKIQEVIPESDQKADVSYDEAIKVFGDCLKKDANDLGLAVLLARAYTYKGELCRLYLNQRQQADDLYDMALKVLEVNPAATEEHRSMEALCLLNKAISLGRESADGVAKNEEALRVAASLLTLDDSGNLDPVRYRQFVERNHDIAAEILHAFARAKLNSSWFMEGKTIDDVKKSQRAREEALALYDVLLAEFKEYYPYVLDYKHEKGMTLSNLGFSHNRLGKLYSHLQNRPESSQNYATARAYLRRATELLEELTKSWPNNPAYRQSLARSMNNLANTALGEFGISESEGEKQKYLAEAHERWKQTAEQWKILIDEDHREASYYKLECGKVRGGLAELAEYQQDYQQALAQAEAAITYKSAALDADRRPDYVDSLGLSYKYKAKILVLLGPERYGEAIEALKQANELGCLPREYLEGQALEPLKPNPDFQVLLEKLSTDPLSLPKSPSP